MAESRRKEASAILSFLGGEVTVDRLKKACADVLSECGTTELMCRHDKRCYRRGTKDGVKAPCIRRSKMLAKLHIASAAKSHLRAYHLAFFSQASLNDIQSLQSDPSKVEIRHLCGHSECDNPAHLKLGSVLENEQDKHYHFVLDKVKNPEQVLEVLKQNIAGLDVL
jgi:hypothetical protein